MTSTPEFFSPVAFALPAGFSHIARVRGGSLAFIAGQVSRDGSGALVGEGDFAAQVEQVFANLNTAIETAGGRMTDVLKLNYYCVDSVDPSQLPVIRDVLARYFDAERLPASTFVVVRRLVRAEWLLEIDAVVAIGD